MYQHKQLKYFVVTITRKILTVLTVDLDALLTLNNYLLLLKFVNNYVFVCLFQQKNFF